MDALTIMDFISKHGEETASLFPLGKSERFIQKLLDAGQVLFKYSKGKLVGVMTYYRTPTEAMGKIYTHNWDLPAIYNKGPYLFVDQVVVHPKYRHQNIMNQFIKRLNYLNPPVKYGMWNDENGEWHKQDKEYSMKTNCGIIAFDKISGMLNGRSNVISLATLAQIAQDNEFLLYPMKVKSSELGQLQTPYILHSDFHFETITDPMDLIGVPLEDEVYVLTTNPDVGEVVDAEEAKKVRGSKKAMRVIAPIGLGILGAIALPGIGAALGPMLGGSLGSLMGALGGGFGAAGLGTASGLAASTGIGLGTMLGTAAGNALTGKPNWGGAALAGGLSGAGAGLAGSLGGTAAKAGSVGTAGGQSGSALGTSTAGLGSGFGGSTYTPLTYGTLTGGLPSSGAGALANVAGTGSQFGTNFATQSLGSSLGSGLVSNITPYVSSMMSKSTPTNAFMPSTSSASFIQPTLNSSNVSASGSSMLNPLGGATNTTSATGAAGGSMPSLIPATMSGGAGGGAAGTNILSQLASGAGKMISGGGGGAGLSGILSKIGVPGLLGAGMLGYNMLRKSPSIDTSAYDDYARQMQMMYASGGTSPYAQMAIPELKRGIGAGVEGIFPSTDSKWYTSQLAQKESELAKAEQALGNQYALYGRVNSPEHIQALTDLRTAMGQQMDTLKAQMAETNRSQNIQGMQTYLDLAMRGDQNAFAALANALGSVADAKAAMSAYQAGFKESRLGNIGQLGASLVANQFNPMAGMLRSIYG